MLVKMKKSLFDSLDDISLIWRCIETTIQQIQGKSFAVKSEVTTHLTNGQRALLMFQILYGHSANGVKEFFSQLSYLLSQKGVWAQLKRGIRYFGDTEMLGILEDMEGMYNKINITNDNSLSINKTEAEFQSKINKIDRRLSERFPVTIKLVGLYIRSHVEEFLQIEDE